jgi:dipeptidase
MSGNQKYIIAGVLFTAAVAGYVTIYLPFYSTDIEDLRKKAQSRPAAPPKSMWGNMDKEIKGKRDTS